MKTSRMDLLLALLVSVPLQAAPAHGQAVAATPTPAQLVQQLGSDSFQAREEASRQLQKLGRAAVGALEAGLKHPDREVRQRCEDLLPLARRSDLDIELDAFVQRQRDPQAPPLVGWNRFRGLAGDDLPARLLFTQLYRKDRPLLELLEQKPEELARQLFPRVQKLQQQFAVANANNKLPEAVAEVHGLLLAGCLATIDTNQFYQLTNVFYNRVVVSEIRQNPASRRLAGRLLSARDKDVNALSQAAWLANSLGLQDAVHESLKGAVRKHVEEAVKAEDLNRLQQCAYLVSNLALEDVIETKIRPVLRKLAEAAARGNDLNRLQQAANVAQALELHDVMEHVLRPAAVRHIQAAAEKMKDTSSFYQARYLAQVLNLNDVFETAMRPAAVRLICEAADNLGDQSKFYNALALAQNLNLPEALEGVLRPAARRQVVLALEQPGDWNQLNRAITLCRQLQLTDTLEQTVKPVFRRQAQLLAESTDMARLSQVYHACLSLGATDLVEQQIKPALRRYFARAGDQKLDQNALYQGLNLARTLQLKEAVPVALKAAAAREVGGYARGQAILFVAQLGTRDQLAQLRPLLDDATEVGSAGVNWLHLRAQVRDVVLAVLLVQNGQNPADFGFPYFQMIRGINVFQTSASCCGFAEDKDRQATIQKFKEWQQKQKKG